MVLDRLFCAICLFFLTQWVRLTHALFIHRAQVMKVFQSSLQTGLSMLFCTYEAQVAEGFHSFSANWLPLHVSLDATVSSPYFLPHETHSEAEPALEAPAAGQRCP